jgi:MerR family transcriptional regulator, thiopeptide resistance regulator
MSGVTARTLRHYDDIGLLRPARVATNGYRWYGRDELLRLQRILILRELGVPLPRIQEVLDGGRDQLAALLEHRADLVRARERLDELLRTVDRTIADVRGEATLREEEFFAGFADRRRALRDDLAARYGAGVEAHFATAEAVTAGWTAADHERAAAEGRELLERLSRARAAGAAVDDEAVLDLMAEHHAAVLALWPADPAAYAALGDLLVQNPEQRAMVEAVDPQLPPWLAAAVRAFAARRLGHDGSRPGVEPEAREDAGRLTRGGRA